MKMLITGSNGFMGSNLLTHFRDKYTHWDDIIYGCGRKMETQTDPLRHVMYAPIGHDDIAWFSRTTGYFKVDLTIKEHVQKMMDICQPEVILHFAANPLVRLDESNPTQILDDNIKATQHLLQYCPEGTHFVFASTIIVYQNAIFPPTEYDNVEPKSIYGVTKLASEGLVNSYQELRDIVPTNLRMCATVGPNLTHGVVYDFVNKLKTDDKYLDVIGRRPGSRKPFCHIDDVISAVDMVVDKTHQGTFNVLPDNNIDIEQLAHAVMDSIGIHKEINWLGEKANWKGDNRYLMASNDKLKRYGWTPKFRSEEAIEDVVKEFNENK